MRWSDATTHAVVLLICAAGCSYDEGRPREPDKGMPERQQSKQAAKGGNAMSPSEELFKMINDIIASRPFSAERISKITGHQLYEQQDKSNEYFSFYASKSTDHRLIEAVSLGVPQPRSTQPDGFVGLTLAPGPCLGEKEIRARYGDSPENAGPPPPPLRDAPRYIRYHQAWGTLSFGFERSGRECLTKVGIDTIKR